jgi:hypothetical protein
MDAMGEPTIENFPADLDLNEVFARAESLAREHAQLTRRNLGIIMADTDVLNSLPGGALITVGS